MAKRFLNLFVGNFCWTILPSKYVRKDDMIITVAGIINPKTRIKSMYDLLLFDECQSGAHPRPDISGMYLPHPSNGGIDKENESVLSSEIYLNMIPWC